MNTPTNHSWKVFGLLVATLAMFQSVGVAQTTGVRLETNRDGSLKVIQIPAAHIPQTTRVNCGAAAAKVINFSETYKRRGVGSTYTESFLKTLFDIDESSGINKSEMATGLGKTAGHLNDYFKFTGSRAISTSWSEKGESTTGRLFASTEEIKLGISTLQFWMIRSKSCIPIQGNVDGFWAGIFGRGDHWYVVYASGNANATTPWVAVVDSVYKSPVFNDLQNSAIPPSRILYAAAVKDIWHPTGPSGSFALGFVVNSKR